MRKEEDLDGNRKVLELLFLDGVTAEDECLTASTELDPFQEKVSKPPDFLRIYSSHHATFLRGTIML